MNAETLFALPDPVLAASRWTDNAALIEDCARLGYLHRDWLTLDPTFGEGKWWTRWCPDRLVCHDLHKLDGVDFADLPHADGEFDVSVFDPPYVSVGGRSTSGIPEMHDRYGLTEAPRSPEKLQVLIEAGLTEVTRVVRPGGFILVKCQDYISSRKLWLGTHHTLTHGLALGLECFDRMEHIGDPRPQPPGRPQQHARRNLSTLFVFQKRGTP